MRNLKTSFVLAFILATFILSICLAKADLTPKNDTLLSSTNSSNNNSIYINSTIWLYAFNVTNEGYIQLYNVTSNLTHTPKFYNINDTYSSRIDMFNIGSNLLIYNTTYGVNSLYTTIANNDGDINISVRIGEGISVMKEYNITYGATRSDDPINITYSKNSSSYVYTITLNSSLITSVIVPVYVQTDETACKIREVGYVRNSSGIETSPSWTCNSGFISIPNTVGIDYGVNTIYIRVTSVGAGSGSGGGGSGDDNTTSSNYTNGTNIIGDFSQNNSKNNSIKSNNTQEDKWTGGFREQADKAFNYIKIWLFEKGLIVYVIAGIIIIFALYLAFGRKKTKIIERGRYGFR